MKLLQSLVLAIALLTTAACTQAQNKNKVDAQTFAAAITNPGNVVLVDVRTPEEFNSEHIKGATNINWQGDDFIGAIEKLDKDEPVYVYCHSGKRSADAAKKMRKNGFMKVYELEGGIEGWKAAGEAVE